MKHIAFNRNLVTVKFMEKMPKEKREKMCAGIPSKRMGEAKEVANLALFLASDESTYINGQAISVDGGQTSQLATTGPAIPVYE